jgi:hypothetical protein
MSKQARSARGDLVDFDLLAIKQQLATKPVPVSVNQRRKFIDEKDGIKVKTAAKPLPLPSALSVAMEAASVSAAADEVEALAEQVTEDIAVETTSTKK